MAGRRNAILTQTDAANQGNLRRDFCGRQHPAMPGLRTLADLEFDHFHLVEASDLRELYRIEMPVLGTTTEITGADFPDQIATILPVIWADAALAGVVREASHPGAG